MYNNAKHRHLLIQKSGQVQCSTPIKCSSNKDSFPNKVLKNNPTILILPLEFLTKLP